MSYHTGMPDVFFVYLLHSTECSVSPHVSANVDISTVRHVPHRGQGGPEILDLSQATAVSCDIALSELQIHHRLGARFYTGL